MPLEWFAEPLSPSGGLSAEGFYKLLGKPNLDPLSVLVREAAQNSWDARLADGTPVDFEISLGQISSDAKRVLRDGVFSSQETRPEMPAFSDLFQGDVDALIISDRNTHGLGGPLRADEVSADDVKDWANFILNSGMPKNGAHTGGSYGFGKTITFVASQVRTIVVNTRTMHNGNPQHRLIAAAVGEGFTRDERRFTGRHWWGEVADDAILPLLGEDAERLAAEIGMPAFKNDELGTNILVLAPDLAGRTRLQAVNYLADAILWNLWPKIVPDTYDKIPMHCRLRLDGIPVRLPKPEERPPLQHFVEIFQAMERGGVEPLTYKLDAVTRHSKQIGRLGTAAFATEMRAKVDDGAPDEHNVESPERDDKTSRGASPFADQASHHIALLRTPELVVTYLEGPAASDPVMEWAGVFRVEDEYDEVFSNAEPSTHDSWNSAGMPNRNERNIVRKAMSDIRRCAEVRWLPAPRNNIATDSTARIADRLSHLVLGSPGAGKGDPDPLVGAQPVKPSVSKPRLELVQAQADVEFGVHLSRAEFRLIPSSSPGRTRLSVEVGIALGTSEFDSQLDETLTITKMALDGEERVTQTRRIVEMLSVTSPVSIILEATNSGRYAIMWNIDTNLES